MRAFILLIALVFTTVAHAKPNFATLGPQRDGEAARVYLPVSYSAHTQWPVILLLHGYGENPEFIARYFGYDKQTAERGYILIVPPGNRDGEKHRFWNATSACCDFQMRGVDDVAYLKDVLKKAQATYAIDPRRIYLAGHSNGAFMAHTLACEMSEQIAAIVSFAGVLDSDLSLCQPTSPVSILQIAAIDDDTIHYNGGDGFPPLKKYPGAIQTVQTWLSHNHCATNASASELNITKGIYGNDTMAQTWDSCAGGSSVALWTIRAHKPLITYQHTPFLNQNFTAQTLDFLLSKQKPKSDE